MKFKKIMSLAMAMIMAMALTVPALGAADSTTQSRDLTGTTQKLTINLAVSGGTKMVFNPYKIAVKVADDGGLAATGGVDENGQIITRDVVITNKSNIPLDMTATLGLEIKAAEGDTAATISSKEVTASTATKQVYLYADFSVFDDNTAANLKGRDDRWQTGSKLVGAAGAAASDGTAATGAKHKSGSEVKIPASGNTGASDDATANYVVVHLDGNCSPAPTTPWKDTDKVDVHMSFQFAPKASEEKYKVITGSIGEDGSAFTETPAAQAPTMYVSYSKDAISQAPGALGNTLDKIFYSAADKKVAGTTYAGYLVTVKPHENSTTKKIDYRITGIAFKDESGNTIKGLSASKVDSKNADTAWTFTMPAQNVLITFTLESTSGS